jgi:diguanylate cyclase (GGDEF)-like protein
MFWRRKDTPSVQLPAVKPQDTVSPPSTSRTDGELNDALDAIAEILRVRARYAYSVDSDPPAATAEVLEQWAKHILVRSAPPTAPPKEEQPEILVIDRDWRGLVDSVSKRARREQEFVNGSVRDMRDAIFSLVESIRRTSVAQGKTDGVLKHRISALGQAVESGSVEMLKREAQLVADAVGSALEEQRKLHEQQNAELKARLEALGEQLEQTRREGDTDPLTRLANRRAFDLALERSLTIASVVDRPLTLLMIDVDHFKSVNDQHGHPAGDEVLRAISDTLSRAFPRRSDTVARYGGEEFAIILPDSGEKEVGILADRLLNAVRGLRVRLPSERMLAATVSVGAAIASPNETVAELVARADKALYASKRAGRNRWCVASSTPSEPSRAA